MGNEQSTVGGSQGDDDGFEPALSSGIAESVLANIASMEAAHPGYGRGLTEAVVRERLQRSYASKDQKSLQAWNRLTKIAVTSGPKENLDCMIAGTRDILKSMASNDPDRRLRHNELGFLLRWKFERTQSLEDIDEAIEQGRLAISLSMGLFHTSCLFLSHLARSLSARFAKSGDAADLEEAVLYARKAVVALPPGHTTRATCLNNLGNVMAVSFSSPGGSINDIDEAISSGKQSLEALVPGTRKADRIEFLQELAEWHVQRYNATRRLSDLDEAIKYGELADERAAAAPADLALNFTRGFTPALEAGQPMNTRQWMALFQKLSKTRMLRFGRTKLAEDRDAAERYSKEAATLVAETPLLALQQEQGRDREWSAAPPGSGMLHWPDLESCKVDGKPNVGLANAASGTGRARSNRFLYGEATGELPQHAIKLPHDLEGARALFRMCAMCAELGLRGEDFLPRPFSKPGTRREEQDVLFKKTFRDMAAERECPLCKLAVYALRQSCEGTEETEDTAWDELTCTLSLVRFSSYFDHENNHESFRFLRVEGWLISRPEPVCRADLLPVESDLFRHAFIGRQLGLAIAPDMIRRWIQQCDVMHGESCARQVYPGLHVLGPPLSSKQAAFDALHASLYFVDVRLNCVAHAPLGSKYVALSYVWGNIPSLRASRGNIERLKTPSSLMDLRAQLPAVINDAMTLVGEIGERYLWVDSLCILQDDEENKQVAINQMDSVYENAYLTIVAAEGTDAAAGLPGVGGRARSQSQRCGVIGPRLRMIVPHSMKVLEKSKWASRAWTFQEELASPRRLIFHNGQVTFKCSWDAPCREDVTSEYQIFGMEDYVYKLPSSQLMDRAHMKYGGKAVGVIGAMSLIGMYSRRTLTYPSDVLNAFAGVASIIREDCGAEMRYGIPWRAVSVGLMWHLAGVPPARRREGFPSWSWCGWEGAVAMALSLEGISLWTAKYSWIRWYAHAGGSKFQFLPQEQCQPSPLPSGPSTLPATAQPFRPDDSPLRSMIAAHRAFRRDKFTNDMIRDLASVALGARQITAVPSPQYTQLLEKHGCDSSAEQPTTLTIDSDHFGLDATMPLQAHTLYFRTLRGPVFASFRDLDGNAGPGYSGWTPLYDQNGKCLGVAQLTLNEPSPDLQGLQYDCAMFGHRVGEPEFERFPIQMALLSGPCECLPVTRYRAGHSREMQSLFGRYGSNLKFYQVLLLERLSRWDHKLVTSTYSKVYERAGFGEIAAPLVENMEGLEWDDILLQ